MGEMDDAALAPVAARYLNLSMRTLGGFTQAGAGRP